LAQRSEGCLDLHRVPIDMSLRDGTPILQGEVQDVVTKKLPLEAVAAAPGISGIVDRLNAKSNRS
jgi:hypothetical protein